MMTLILKNKVVFLSIFVVFFLGFGILFWWYQDIFYRDSLVAYIPEETILYTHFRVGEEIPSSVQNTYFDTLENFLGESKGNFEKKYLPYISEISFFIFIDPDSKKEIRGAFFRSPELLSLSLKPSKKISHKVFAVTEEEKFFEYMKWHHHRNFRKKLQNIARGKTFSFFIQQEELVKYVEKIQLPYLNDILNTYISRWQPFLFGAAGSKNGKLIFSLSDFSVSSWNLRAPMRKIPLNNFSLLYKIDHPKSFFEENGFSFEDVTFKDAPMGVAFSLSEKGERIPLFFFELIAENEDKLQKSFRIILGKFIPVRRSFALPDGEIGYENIFDESAFSWDGEQTFIDGKPYPLFIRATKLSANSYRVFISQKQELLSDGADLFSKENGIASECISQKAIEILKFKKDILPESLKNIFSGETYLFARTSQTGFSVEGCEE